MIGLYLIKESGTKLHLWGLIRLISTLLHSSHNPTAPIHVTHYISIIWFWNFKNFSYICISKFRKTVKFFAKSCSREVAASFSTRSIRFHSTIDWSALPPPICLSSLFPKVSHRSPGTLIDCSYLNNHFRSSHPFPLKGLYIDSEYVIFLTY